MKIEYESDEYIYSCDKETGRGYYNGLCINDVSCSHIDKCEGGITCDCLDFPSRCLECKYNEKRVKSIQIVDNRKHYFKEK